MNRPNKTVYKVNFTCLIDDGLGMTCYRQEQVVADDIEQAVAVFKIWAEQENLKEIDILAVYYSHEVKGAM